MSGIWQSGLRLFDEDDVSRAFKAMNVDKASRVKTILWLPMVFEVWTGSLKVLW